MDILIIIGLLILGCLINSIWEPGFRPANRVARAYLVLNAILAVVVWLFYFAGIKSSATLKVLDTLLHYGGYVSRLLLGFLAGNILFKFWLKDTMPNSQGLKTIVRTTLWGISIAIGNSFMVATVGKSMNMSYMAGFFKQSGYALWFLYFIMAAESAGAVGVLLHFKLKTGPLASIGLMLIMFGAIYTHWHNHDQFSDSYAAVSQLINLSIILFLYYLEKQVTPKPADTQIYVV
jgi:putative oxidoreductase